MPRIDPIQLLNCLSVLLSPNGGIKSRNEVQRLAGLMTKFSKKLVSKCIYVQILKCTETELLGSFMGSGGWLLVHMWLTESIVAKNWPLVKELLELLLLCPVDIERLKTNNCPKLVKELSKDGNHFAIRALASKLVEQWLKTVKGEHVVPLQETDIAKIILNAQPDVKIDVKCEDIKEDTKFLVKKEIEDELKSEESLEPTLNHQIRNDEGSKKEKSEIEEEQETLPVLKISVKDGKQIISQVDDGDVKEQLSDGEKSKDKHRHQNKEKSNDRSSSTSKSSSKHSSKSSSSSSSSDKHKSSHKSSSSSSSRSKDKQRDKEKHSSHSSKSKSDSKKSDKSSSSSKSRDDRSHKSDKEKGRDNKDQDKIKQDKSKDALKSSEKCDEKLPPSIHKLGKIPKLSEVKKEKPSISIEVRKPEDPKPKTVKTFHSKFRKHGLEEEVKPPPSRAAILSKKVTPIVPPTVTIPKRPSPIHNETPPPEKKPKTIESIEKPGSIKLIPPKPKRNSQLKSSLVLTTLFNSIGSNFFGGKSKMYKLLGSKVFLSLVNFFLEINAEITSTNIFRSILTRICSKKTSQVPAVPLPVRPQRIYLKIAAKLLASSGAPDHLR